MSIFDAIKVADDLEQACIDTLELWFPVYIREIELQQSEELDVFPLPKSFLTADKVDRDNSAQLPTIVVVSPGLSGKKPMQEGDGSFRAPFSIGIGIFVAGKDRSSTKRLVRVYTAISRTIMLQKQSLGGFADGTTWLDESYDDNFTFTDGTTVGSGQVVFEVEVVGVVNRYGGPKTPPDPAQQPGSNWPLVQSVSATIEVEES